MTQVRLTIEQALKRGVTAHQEGRFQDAEQIYRAILQAQPNHPDANHNLGLLAVSFGKPINAIPLFRLALDAGPNVEQFWLSYIETLIEVEEVDTARQVLSEGERAGVSPDKLLALSQKLSGKEPRNSKNNQPDRALPKNLQRTGYRQGEEKRKALKSAVNHLPSQHQLDITLEHYQAGRYAEATAHAESITRHFPDHQIGWKILGAALRQLGNKSEAIAAHEKCVELEPQDAEAHFNMGVLLSELGTLARAETSLRRALELKPEYIKARFNLGGVLKKLGRLDEAAAMYEELRELTSDLPEAHRELGNIYRELGKLAESEESLTKALALNPENAQALYDLGITLQELDRHDDAVLSLSQAVALDPANAYAQNNLGLSFSQLSRNRDAEQSFRRALSIKPDAAVVHFNLGNLLLETGRQDEAEESFNRALASQPNFIDAHYNLGVVKLQQKRFGEAERILRKVLALRPDYAEAHCNLAITLNHLGRVDESIDAFCEALNIKENFGEAKVGLGLALVNARFSMPAPELYPHLINLLTEGNFIRPGDVSRSILSLLRQDQAIKGFCLERRAPKTLAEHKEAIEALDSLPLLHHLMRVCPLPDPEFEKFFVAMRRGLLEGIDGFELSQKDVYFFSTLALHCFVNDYVYPESVTETELVEALETDIFSGISLDQQPKLSAVLCLATYRPLHQYDWCEKVSLLELCEDFRSRLIDGPVMERKISKCTKVLGEINDAVSRKVRAQYEENPYPRWVRTPIHLKPQSIASLCDSFELRLQSSNVKAQSAPEILIAGCGTGQHAINTATRFVECFVTAVDLSLASLAYAQRKTIELGLKNLEYLQADILDLHLLQREFDIVESAGVLHHMNDPMAGWKKLTGLLKVGGLMRVGLYSELARRPIVKIREEIEDLSLGSSAVEIRKFRQGLLESKSEHHRLVTASTDFYNLNEIRDLIFHVQEHRFSLPQITDCLNHLGLAFCGFEDKRIVSKFIGCYGEDADIYDLELWTQFEEDNPRTFARMYQFWCQKV